jgi:hypothetical protein
LSLSLPIAAAVHSGAKPLQSVNTLVYAWIIFDQRISLGLLEILDRSQ